VDPDMKFPRLVSLAAHDLRTPLATIHGFAQTLIRMGDLGEPKQKYMEMIDTASRQLAELLEELGTAARIEGGRYDPSLQPIDTLELAQTAAELLGKERVRVSGTGGERTVPAEEFFLGVYMTAAGPGELLTKITIPPGRSDGFASVPIGVDGTCIVNAAASLNGGVRVVLGCVGATPVAVEPASADAEAVRDAVRDADLDPPSDVHASADYRRHLAEVVAARAVERAGKGS